MQFDPSGSPPSAPQRTHWYAYVIGVSPAHVPTLADRTARPRSVPLIDGSTVLRGGPVVVDCVTASVGFDAAVAEPSRSTAVTWTRSRRPMSSVASV